MNEGRYRLIGSTASPYAIKLRALLRYRKIPFDWVIMTRALRKQAGHLRPNLIPVLQYPDGSFRGETTTLACDLETRHPDRSFPKIRPQRSSAISSRISPTNGPRSRFFSIGGVTPKIKPMSRDGQLKNGRCRTPWPEAPRRSSISA